MSTYKVQDKTFSCWTKSQDYAMKLLKDGVEYVDVLLWNEEQIIEIAENHFFCNVSVMEYSARREDIIKFARAIHENGYNEGYDEGWESSKESTKMNSMEGIYD